eukprot:gb/GEZJ01006325.1/.p1 GENE.gb/GEZJ01006325.1/~~gb/GEZJ01006325.1/.p1  ORF type:complete len:120 (+),score=5.67 gb/GEZJ01006325.1/:910-1269(+)
MYMSRNVEGSEYHMRACGRPIEPFNVKHSSISPPVEKGHHQKSFVSIWCHATREALLHEQEACGCVLISFVIESAERKSQTTQASKPCLAPQGMPTAHECNLCLASVSYVLVVLFRGVR